MSQFTEQDKLSGEDISNILRKKKRRNIMLNTEVDSETITDLVQQETVNYNKTTEIDIVQLRTKEFEDIKSMKKIGGVYIS